MFTLMYLLETNNDAATNTEPPIEKSDLSQVHLARLLTGNHREVQQIILWRQTGFDQQLPTSCSPSSQFPIFFNFTPQKTKKKILHMQRKQLTSDPLKTAQCTDVQIA